MSFLILPGYKNTSLALQAQTLAAAIHITRTHGGGLKETFLLADREHGFLQLGSGGAGADLDPTDTIITLARNGCELHAIAMTQGDGNRYGTAWVSPRAFLAAVTSAPFTEGGFATENIDAILDIEGYGRIETRMRAEDMDRYFKAAARVNPYLMRIDPDMARAAFDKPGYSVLDASRIVGLRPHGKTGIDVNLRGVVTMGYGRINFEINSGGPHAEKRLADSFCAAIASRAPQLVKCEGADAPHYIDPARVAWASVKGNRMQVTYGKPSNASYPAMHSVPFASPEEANKALAALVRHTNAVPRP